MLKDKTNSIVIKNAIKRREGFLYYIDKHGNICEAPLKRNVKKLVEENI